jgi:hypothetical protein
MAITLRVEMSRIGRKDGQELRPDPGGTIIPLAADVASVFPSPFLKLNRRLSHRKVIKLQRSPAQQFGGGG